MATETLSCPPAATGEGHGDTLLESRESSQASQGESRDMAKNIALTGSPEDSSVPAWDDALISFAEDPVVEEPSTSVGKDGRCNESALSPLRSSETFKTADSDQEPNSSHFVLQSKEPDLVLEQLKTGDISSLSPPGEDARDPECQDKTPEALSEGVDPAETSAQVTEGEEERPPNYCEIHPTDSSKQSQPLDMPSELSQGDKGNLCVGYRDSFQVHSEQQKPDSNISSQPGVGEESGEMNSHGQTPGVAPEFTEPTEAAGSPQETARDAENDRDHLRPRPPILLLQEAESPRQALEGSCSDSPGHDPSGASSPEPRGASDAADIRAGLQPGCQEMADTEEGERAPVAAGEVPGDPKGPLSEETPEDNSQVWEKELVAPGRECVAVGSSQALALADPLSGAGICCQQRAAGTGWDTFPEARAPLSPVATSDSLGPAPGGLAPEGDKDGREGPNAPESRAAGSRSKALGEVGTEAVVASQGEEEAAGIAGPEGTVGEAVGAKFLAREVPSVESGTGLSPEDPSEAMVLACSEESLDTRRQEDSHNLSGTQYLASSSEGAGSQAKPGGGVLFHSADTTDLAGTTDPACATPFLDERSGAGGPRCSMDWMENDAGSPENYCPTAETPIEREIRVHLEREELLRQQRGLAGSRGPQEYVEVQIRSILSQSVPQTPLPKEKERQWAGAQMQRDIQRECQREEDLVQLGKVRGAYDRGTPQELQEKKMLFEQQAAPGPGTPVKTVAGSSQGHKERSCAEANGVPSPVAPASGALPERPSAANPFFCLRAKSPQSLLEREVQEAQERERELQRQRHKIYGAALPRQPEEALDQDEDVPFQPERLPCKKLDVTWPPPSLPEPCQVNGLHQPERSPRSRQKSSLIQRWESGTVGNQENHD
ncbi:uncharacterized protein MISP3 [Sphaerodactylus townsendi]|uniref:Uncharacterized protein n=1 Tax=Sphaerodactylus townsendi TaxID=933632 RepID=A0ACB8ELH7_9SAUR|nr:uncharacterized protein MISP3 [Sphaerodactylus townsendi]XP_048343615.1 uncharacterized protein MISP3 [Sphaerodactylus townsendi]